MKGYKHHRLVKFSSIGLTLLVPVGMFLAPSPVVLPIDLLIGIVAPMHAHSGMIKVIHDYLPRPVQGALSWVWLLVTGATLAGLFRLNFEGKGICATLKDFWRKPDYTL